MSSGEHNQRESPSAAKAPRRSPSAGRYQVAVVHDYLTQRGGAERVVLSLLKAFPEADLFTSLYEPARTFHEFSQHRIHTMPINRLGILRRNHRLALPFLAASFSRVLVDADVVVCSSSGWAHGVRASRRKIVYCHTPPRWLHSDHYLGRGHPLARVGLVAIRPRLQRWDLQAALSADRYLCNSRVVEDRVLAAYGIRAEVLAPAPTLDPEGRRVPVKGLGQGFFLCVARLLPYKNVAQVTEAFRELPDEQLVVVGDGPERTRLQTSAPTNVHYLFSVSDEELRWLYAGCRGFVSAAEEDFGLAPLEAASFGRPAAVLARGGHLDTVEEAETGVFFDDPNPSQIAAAIRTMCDRRWEERLITAHAQHFSEVRFIERIRSMVADERAANQ